MNNEVEITGAYNPSEWVQYRANCDKLTRNYNNLQNEYNTLQQNYEEVLRQNEILKKQFNVELEKIKNYYRDTFRVEINSHKRRLEEHLQQQFQQNSDIQKELSKNQQKLSNCLQQLNRYSTFEFDAIRNSLPI